MEANHVRDDRRGLCRGLFLALIVTIWFGMASAIETLPEDANPGEAVTLYRDLGQNIEKEASLYSKYRDYSENLRLKNFWEELEKLNLARDEIILTIRFLESNLEQQKPETTTASSNISPFVLSQKSGTLENIFSRWRPFYFLISGGFFLIITALLVTAVFIKMPKRQMSDGLGGKTSLLSPDHYGDDMHHKGSEAFKKAA